jgi:hypothetical protein
MQGLTTCRGFQEPRNRCLESGVGPPDTAALLALATETGEDSAMFWEATSMVIPFAAAASLTTISPIVASVALLSMTALSAATTSSSTFFVAVASTTSYSAATAFSSTTLDVPGASTRDVTVGEPGRGEAIAANACSVAVGPPTGCSPVRSNLLF